jgi:hypothetical protein
MAWRQTLRSLPGHLAFLLATLTTTVFSVTAVFSFFYEGWGQSVATAAVYLVPPVLLVGVCAAGVRQPKVGGLLLLAGGAATGAWWLWRQAASGGLTPIILQTAVVFFAPVLLTGGLFLLEARHRRLLAAEGVGPSSRWWGGNYRLALVAGIPILAVAIVLAQQLPDLLARHDDGLRGTRTIAGNGVTLVWAPEGPGWNWRQTGGGYPSWSMLATYGVSPVGLKPKTGPREPDAGAGAMERTGLCGYLSEDGTSLLPEAIFAWRLPTADEVVRSLTRGGTSAGCTWDGRSPHASCERPPDKETPLWAPDQAPIYYLTSNVAGAGYALGVNYTGGVTPHRKSSGVGYRCVKAPS